jgi:hypothetical protein
MSEVSILLLLVGIAGGLFGGVMHYRPIIAEMNAQAAQKLALKETQRANAVANNDAVKTELGALHAQANAVIDHLVNTPAARVQLPKTPAPAACGASNPSSGGQPTATGNGTLPDTDQAAFDQFTKDLESLAYEADKVTEQCRVVSKWALKLP